MRFFVVFSILISIVYPVFCQSKSEKHLTLAYKGICCDKTTEWGEDEVYFIISLKRSDGAVATARYPTSEGSNNQLNMNDGKDDKNRCLPGPVSLIGFDLANGIYADIVVNVFEQDGGTTKQWKDIAQTVVDYFGAEESPDVFTQIVAFLIKIFPEKVDTDDWIGGFTVKVKNSDDKITTTWKPLDRFILSEVKNPSDAANSCHMGFNGDGSTYRINFGVQ